MNGSLFGHVKQVNKDKVRGQRAFTALCLVLVFALSLVFWHLKTVGVVFADDAICGMTEHTHGKDCAPQRKLTCENGSHAHTERCYTTVWSCGLEEHRHTAECFPDRTADVETAKEREATLPALSGHPVTDLVRIAASQTGYTESERNVEVKKLGDGSYEKHGYTRYGDFIGRPYCENWSAAFASFCLYYAGFDENAAPRSADCDGMKRLWEKADAFSKKGERDALPGDLVFIDRDGDGRADSVGIVTRADAINVTAIEGSSNDKVEENRIALSGKTVLGFGVPAAVETAKEAEASKASSSGAAPIAHLRAPKNFVGPLRSGANADVALDDYITGVSGSGTTKVDENHYQTLLELSFSVEPETAMDLIHSGHKFIYDLPGEITILDSLIDDGPFYAYKIDSNPLELAFTYDFIPNGDGTYRIEIFYDEDYVQDAIDSGSDYIMNVLRCRCYITVSEDGDENGLDVSFTVDDSLYIPPDEINENYDISTTKTGSFTSDGKLRYEVTVSSVNGTPSDIDYYDTFVYTGSATIGSPSSVSVVLHKADGSVETSEIPAQGHVTSPAANEYDIAFTLPQLDDNEYYTVVYEYPVSGLSGDDAAVTAYNNVEVDSDDGHDSTTDSSDYFIYNQQRNKIGKDGIPYGDYVQWHISVNDRGGDIAGKVIYDDSFIEARNEMINGTNGIVVQRGWAEATPGVDYEYVYNNIGQIIGIRFLPADGSAPNNNTYHVTYYTNPDVAYGETVSEHNEAEFDGDTASYDVVVTGGDIEKTSNGDEDTGYYLHVIDWTVDVKVPVEGIAAGTTFSDTFSPEGHYMTQAQYDALVDALEAAWGDDVAVTPVYTSGRITGYGFTVGAQSSGYLFDDGYVDEIVWQYQTTGDMDGKLKETFLNTFTDGQKTLPVSHVISPQVKKLNARNINDWQTVFSEDPITMEFDHDDPDQIFVWIAEVTPVPDVQQYRVTDVLPEGVELVGVKVFASPLTAYNYGMEDYTNFNLTIDANGNIYGELGNLWNYRTSASGTLSETADGRQAVDITLTRRSEEYSLLNYNFNVIYYCRLAEDAWPTNGTVRLELNNTVSVYADGEEYGEADNQINIDATNEQDVVGKSGSWDRNTHLITYTVDINPTAANLLTSSGGTVDPDWLTFTDVLGYTARQGTGTGEVVLNLNSVTLEKEENGVWTELQNVQWTARTENDQTDPNMKQAIIEMRVPDETHLRLTYSYHINSSMANGITLRNTATLEGHGDESGDHNTHIEVEDFQTSAESTYKEYCLIKIDQENGRPLAGAEFTVYVWDSAAGEWSETEKTYTTDSAGKIVIKLLDEYSDGTRVYTKDTAYCIAETKAPPGYILPDDPPLFYYWFSEHQTAPQNAPADFMQTAADVSTSSHRIEAGNQLAPDDIVPVTGVFGVRLLTAGVALAVTGAGTVVIAKKTLKKKRDIEE